MDDSTQVVDVKEETDKPEAEEKPDTETGWIGGIRYAQVQRNFPSVHPAVLRQWQ